MKLLFGFSLLFVLILVHFVGSSVLEVGAFGQTWSEGFESGGGALTYSLSGFPNVPGTQDEGVPDCMEGGVTSSFAFKGSRSNYYKMTIFPCLTAGGNPIDNASHRYYPLYKGRNFKLPALVMFWFYEDAASWSAAAGTRFSPLSIKDQSAPGPPNCDPANDPDGCIPILTTHISPQGIMDCGHCSMTFQSKTIKVPLKKWVLMSALIDKNSNVTEWLDEKVVVQGKTNLPFRIVERWHMGFYGEGNGWQTMYNDEMKVYEVSDRSEAEALISKELDGKPVDGTPPPQPSPTSQPTGLPTPTPTSFPSDSDKFVIGDRVEVIGKSVLNVRSGPGVPNEILGTQPLGSQGVVVAGPHLVNNNYWWKINYDSGVDGWSFEAYLASVVPPTSAPRRDGDIDADGDIDIFDYNIILENYSSTSCGNVADINEDCSVNIFDYNILVENFGL